MMNGRKIKGNTLPEVMVALVILSCVIVIAFQVIGMSGGGTALAVKWEAIRESNNLLGTFYPDSVFRDTIVYPGFQARIGQNAYRIRGLYVRRVEMVSRNGGLLCYRERILK